jgi:SPP1 family predicted phage head-tail adaptor
MISGALSRLIYLQEPVEARTDDGSTRADWSTLTSAWAKVEPLRGREKWIAKKVHSESMCKFTCRHINGLNEKMRVVYDTVPYQIVSIIDRDCGNKYEIYAKADATAAAPVVPTYLLITGVSFTVTKNSITTNYTTSENAKCRIYEITDPDSPAVWYLNATEHATHSHIKTGLASSTNYKIQIYCSTTEGLYAWNPTYDGYYLVKTNSITETGGGLVAIVWGGE